MDSLSADNLLGNDFQNGIEDEQVNSIPKVTALTVYEKRDTFQPGLEFEVLSESAHQAIVKIKGRDFLGSVTGVSEEDLEALPHVFVHLNSENWNRKEDYAFSNASMAKALDESDRQVVYISDLSGVKIFDLDALIEMVNGSTRGEEAPMKHPNILQYIAITTDRLLSMFAKGLNSLAFGRIIVPVFANMEEASAYTITRLSEPLQK